MAKILGLRTCGKFSNGAGWVVESDNPRIVRGELRRLINGQVDIPDWMRSIYVAELQRGPAGEMLWLDAEGEADYRLLPARAFGEGALDEAEMLSGGRRKVLGMHKLVDIWGDCSVILAEPEYFKIMGGVWQSLPQTVASVVGRGSWEIGTFGAKIDAKIRLRAATQKLAEPPCARPEDQPLLDELVSLLGMPVGSNRNHVLEVLRRKLGEVESAQGRARMFEAMYQKELHRANTAADQYGIVVADAKASIQLMKNKVSELTMDNDRLRRGSK